MGEKIRAYLGELVEASRPRDFVFYCGYALYLAFSYMAFHSATMLSSGGTPGHDLDTVFTMVIIGARIAVFLTASILVRFVKSVSAGKVPVSLITLLAGVSACMGFIITAMMLQFSDAAPLGQSVPWWVLGAALIGIGDALITLLWAHFSSGLSLRTVYLFILLSNALGLGVYFVATFLPSNMALPVTVALFLVSAAFVWQALKRRSFQEWEFSHHVLTGAAKRLWHPVLGTAILCFMSGLMLQISGQQDIPLDQFQQTSLVASALAIAILLLPVLLLKKPFNIGRLYVIALPLSAAGFLLLPIIWNAAGGIVNAFAQLGSMVAGIILWCLLAEAARDTRLPSVLLFSGALLCTNAAQLAGGMIGYLNAESFKQGDLALTATALVAMYLILMVALLLFRDKGFEEYESNQLTTDEIEAPLMQRCEEVASAHQLTPRESEILVLLAQGYTLAVASEKLFVSENTVKSHVKSIYQKLGIHTRSELIDMVHS